MRIFVSGPITPRNCTTQESPRIYTKNVDEGIRVSIELMRRGHQVFCPHLSYYVHVHPACEGFDLGYWYEYDYGIIRNWAEAIYHIRTSPGVAKEVALARELGLEIFWKIEDVPDLRDQIL